MLFRLLAGAHYDVWRPTMNTDMQVGLGLFMAIAILVAAWKMKAIRVGAMWTLATLAPFTLWPDGPSIWRYYYLATVGSSFLQAMFLAQSIEHLTTWLGTHNLNLKRALFSLCTLAPTLASVAETNALQAIQYSFSGLFFAKSKRYEKALPQYEKALALDPDSALAMSWRYHQAICQFKTGRTLVAYTGMIDIVPYISGRDDLYAWLIQAHAVLYKMEGVELAANDSFTLYREGQEALRKGIIRFAREGSFRKARSLAIAYLHYFPKDREIAQLLEQSQKSLRSSHGL